MSTSKHPPAGREPDPLPRDDLEDNPGIKSSIGTTAAGEDPHLIEGENTVEGDVVEETQRSGGIDPDHRGRDH